MEIQNNERVLHPRFGSGTVVAVDGNRLTILFDNGMRMRICSPFVVCWGVSEVRLTGKRWVPS